MGLLKGQDRIVLRRVSVGALMATAVTFHDEHVALKIYVLAR
jgi:hypothetical protein